VNLVDSNINLERKFIDNDLVTLSQRLALLSEIEKKTKDFQMLIKYNNWKLDDQIESLHLRKSFLNVIR